MEQTPVHENHNDDLLRMMPPNAKHVIEVGCSAGAMAREFRKINREVCYVGVEIDADYAELARRHCDDVLYLDIEQADEAFFRDAATCDCWVFGDSLEHLRDPWQLLTRIRSIIPAAGCVVACIPNAQHWSVQVRLACGHFRYERAGLFDKTHLRWFTRQTIAEMFHQCGFRIDAGARRTFNEPDRDRFLPLIGALAEAAGIDRGMAIQDAQAFQYVIRAVPATATK